MGLLHSIIEALKPLDNKKVEDNVKEEEIPKLKESWKYSKLWEVHQKWANKKTTNFGEVLELCSDIQNAAKSERR